MSREVNRKNREMSEHTHLYTPHGEALYAALSERLKAAEGVKRIAFDCDKTLIQGDIGEATLATLLLRGGLKAGALWWRPLEERGLISACPEGGLRARYERALSSEEGVTPSLFAELWAAYEGLCALDIQEGYLLAARCWAGYTPHEARASARDEVSEALERPLTPCELTQGHAPRGVRVRPLMRELIERLHAEGVEVWVVSSSQQYTVEAMVAHLGVPPERVMGIEFHSTEEAVVGHDCVTPAPIEEGKRACYLAAHGAPPVAMFGDSRYDLPLMEASGWGVLIDHESPDKLSEVRARAEALGAHVIHASLVNPC
jgi:phosphoserine phosphatase